jgi:hypothetical protein
MLCNELDVTIKQAKEMLKKSSLMSIHGKSERSGIGENSS